MKIQSVDDGDDDDDDVCEVEKACIRYTHTLFTESDLLLLSLCVLLKGGAGFDSHRMPWIISCLIRPDATNHQGNGRDPDDPSSALRSM